MYKHKKQFNQSVARMMHTIMREPSGTICSKKLIHNSLKMFDNTDLAKRFYFSYLKSSKQEFVTMGKKRKAFQTGTRWR